MAWVDIEDLEKLKCKPEAFKDESFIIGWNSAIQSVIEKISIADSKKIDIKNENNKNIKNSGIIANFNNIACKNCAHALYGVGLEPSGCAAKGWCPVKYQMRST